MIYLVRHGATDQPILRDPGDLAPATRDEWLRDHGLSARGRAEATALARRFAKLEPFEQVLASPKRRTRETAQLAVPNVEITIDDTLHEWHADETTDALRTRARAVLLRGEDARIAAFTHGGFVRAVVAALLVGDDAARFGPTFHDLRRILHVWNGSVTIVGHGPAGLELFAVNLCPDIDRFAGG